MKEKLQYAGLVLILFTAMGLGGAMFVHEARSNARAMRSGEWPVTQGEIITSYVSHSSTSRTVSYHPYIEYRYTVSGNTRTSSTYRLITDSFTREESERIVASYPVGRKANIRYDPSDPSIAAIDTVRPRWWGLPGYIIPTVIFGTGLALLIVFARKVLLKKPA